MRKCPKCQENKELEEFPIGKKYKDGRKPLCKICYNIVNKEKYYNSDKSREYYEANRNSKLEAVKKYNKDNREYKIKYLKSYRDNDINKLKRRERYKLQIQNELFRFTKLIKSLISNSFKRKGLRKNSKSEDILGCTIVEFQTYIKSKFEDWMTEENWGLYNGEYNYGWDIDHIIPISEAKDIYDVIKLNHFTNLQPLCSKINRDIKKNRTDYDK